MFCGGHCRIDMEHWYMCHSVLESGRKSPIGIFSVLTDLPAKRHITHQAPESYDLLPYTLLFGSCASTTWGISGTLKWPLRWAQDERLLSAEHHAGRRPLSEPCQVAISSSTSIAWRCEGFPLGRSGAAEPSERIGTHSTSLARRDGVILTGIRWSRAAARHRPCGCACGCVKAGRRKPGLPKHPVTVRQRAASQTNLGQIGRVVVRTAV